MELTYKRATIEDLDILTQTRIEVLRAANKLSDDVDMSDLYQISLDGLLKGDQKMKEKMERDDKHLKESRKLLFRFGIVAAIVLILYVPGIFIGGGYKDFCEAAIPWVLTGIGVAGFLAYTDMEEKALKKSEEK